MTTTPWDAAAVARAIDRLDIPAVTAALQSAYNAGVQAGATRADWMADSLELIDVVGLIVVDRELRAAAADALRQFAFALREMSAATPDHPTAAHAGNMSPLSGATAEADRVARFQRLRRITDEALATVQPGHVWELIAAVLLDYAELRAQQEAP